MLAIKRLVARAGTIMMKSSITALEDDKFKFETLVAEHTESLRQCCERPEEDHETCHSDEEY